MTPDDDDEEEFERFMSLSDEEQDEEVDAALREHKEWWRSLTPAQQFAVRRGRAVETCARWRKLIRDNPHLAELFSENLRTSQKNLVALRFERRTGIAPGRA